MGQEGKSTLNMCVWESKFECIIIYISFLKIEGLYIEINLKLHG